MIVCEICLILVLIFLGVYTSATDIRYGIIQNKVLVATLSIGMILDCIYYGIFAREFAVTFLINLLVISALTVALYAFHFGQQAIVNYYLEYVCYFRRDFMMQEIRLVYPHY